MNRKTLHKKQLTEYTIDGKLLDGKKMTKIAIDGRLMEKQLTI